MEINGIHSVLEHEKKLYPCHVNRISSMGHPCNRYLYYCRTAWDKAAPTEDGLQGIFNTGNILEPQIEKIFTDVGLACDPPLRIIGTQMSTKDKLLEEYQISGTIDGFLQKNNGESWHTLGVIDIKTSSVNIFNSLQGPESLEKYPWTRRYKAQLMLYALAHNEEHCYILFINKNNLYDMKIIDFPVDMSYAESLLQKANEINKAIKAKKPPAKINEPAECTRCTFASLCCPDIQAGEGISIRESVELADALDLYDELKPFKKEFDAVERRLKGMLTPGQAIIAGDYLITWKLVQGVKKPSEGGPYEYFKKTVEKLSTKKQEEAA